MDLLSELNKSKLISWLRPCLLRLRARGRSNAITHRRDSSQINTISTSMSTTMLIYLDKMVSEAKTRSWKKKKIQRWLQYKIYPWDSLKLYKKNFQVYLGISLHLNQSIKIKLLPHQSTSVNTYILYLKSINYPVNYWSRRTHVFNYILYYYIINS